VSSDSGGGKSFLTTRVDKLTNWARKNSLWPMPFGTACCAIELMATLASRFDMSRFGAEAIRFTPRQCDLMIVAGRVAIKELPILKRIWDQMPEPKWCISMGACCSSGGIFDTYTLVQGIDRFIPVDVYIPGCPPRPEAVIDAVIKIQKLVEDDSWQNYKQDLLEQHRKDKIYKGPNFPWENR
jgi:NADH-quinone oxidoreductase subunit B